MSTLFLDACLKKKTPRPPIWLMRQAGRYQKTYREIRSKLNFLELCKNPDLASQVTLDAVDQFGFDAAIIFSDILLLGEAMGFDLSFGKGHGPIISNPFRDASDLKRIKKANPKESLQFVMQALEKTRKKLNPDVSLIGFAGAPFTVASYLIEGGSSKTFEHTKALMSQSPDVFGDFLSRISDETIIYLESQIGAGAEAIQLFDSWVGFLPEDQYEKMVLPHLQKIFKSLKGKVPLIYFGTNTHHLFPQIKKLGVDVVGVDWRIPIDQAWDQLGDVSVQGNLDPQILLTNPEQIKSEALKILKRVDNRPGYIFNLGHGILPPTPEENVKVLVQTIKGLNN